MNSLENNAKDGSTRPKFPCELCPYVAMTIESLEKHSSHHVLNPDAEFVCKKCPFYCSSKIELGIHAMVHATQRRSLEPQNEIPDKKLKIDTGRTSVSPPQARSRMSPFKKASSLSPSQKQLKRNLSTGQIKMGLGDKLHNPLESGSKVTPTKSLWKVKPLQTRSPSPSKSGSSPANKKRTPGFKCESCPYIAHSQKEVEFHMIKHTPAPDRPFKCDLCPYYAVNVAAVTNHKRVHVKPKVESEIGDLDDDDVDDEVASISSKAISSDAKKAAKRSSTSGITCSLCPQTFTMKGNIHKHLKLHTPSPNRPYKCSFCSFCTSSSGSLKIHQSLHESQPFVPKEEEDSGEEESEYEMDEDEEEDDPDTEKYRCEVCPYTTVHRRLIKVHITQHTPSEDRQACCPYCPYYVTVKPALGKHLAVHKEHRKRKKHSLSSVKMRETFDESQHADDERDDTLVDEDEENDHVSEDGNAKKNKLYNCEICPYSTRRWKLMNTHRIQHTPSEDRQACCDYCPYYVTVKSALARHMMVHKEYKEKKENINKATEKSTLDDSQKEEDVVDEEEEDMEDDDIDEDSSDEDDADENKYRCEICPYTTMHRRLIMVHNRQHVPSKDRQACCPYCRYYVTIKHALSRHMLVHKEHRRERQKRLNAERKPVPDESEDFESEANCDEEGAESVDETDVEEASETNEKVYACNICPYTTIHRRLIKVHTIKHTPSADRQARCDYCPYYGSVKSLLGKHMMVHKEYRELKGIDADEESNMETNDAPNYEDDGEDDDDDGDTMRRCNLCPYYTMSTHSLKRHKEFHSPSDERQVQCPYCPYFVKSQARLANHQMVHRQPDTEKESDVEPSTEEVALSCSVCPYVTSSSEAMDVHSKHHMPDEEYPNKCPHCPYYARYASHIERHARLHLQPDEDGEDVKKRTWMVRFNCPICPYKGYDPKLYARHQGLHEPSKERILRCEFCPFYVKTKDGLTKHEILHQTAKEEETDKKPEESKQNGCYICSICPYKTEHVTEFRKHRTHHKPREEWQERCRYCPYYAANYNGLSRHITLHPEYHESKKQENYEDDHENDYQEDEESDDDEMTEETENGSEDVPEHHRCNLCPYIGQPNKLRKHKEMHVPSAKRQAKCPFCPFYVERSGSLGSHLQIHATKKETSKSRTKGDDDDVIHFRTDSDDENAGDTDVTTDDEPETNDASDDSGNENDSQDGSKGKTKSKATKYQCSSCPYLARKTELEIHMAGHRANPKNIYQCHYCTYASSNKASLNSHYKVHQPEYVSTQEALYKVHLGSNQMGDCAPASPAKSDISDVSDCDVLEMANIKQQLITAKIISTPVSRSRFEVGTKGAGGDDCLMEGLMVDKDGEMKLGLFRKMYRCRYCPYTHVHLDKLKEHEQMHNNKSGKYSCCYCTFKSDHKILRNRHMKVHAYQYVPGAREINDYQCEPEEETDDEEEDEEEDMEVSFKDPPSEDAETAEKTKTDGEKSKGESKADDAKLPKAAIKSPNGNSIKIKSKPLLSLNDMPPGMEYYIRQDKVTGQNYLERASVKKWCCEKCPYASMDKHRFENHAMLHASHQRNVCEFCDYSVPVYNFLLEHRKLHLQPNPNLLAMQSVTNLLNLPEVPADVAAAANFPGDSDDPISQFGTHDHMELYENSDQYTEPRKLYHCDRCPYTNVRRDNLLSHMRFHMISSELKCDYCDYSVGKHELLVQHIKVHFVDPNTIKLDLNSNPVICSTDDEKPPTVKPVLKDTANVRSSSAEKQDAKKPKTGKLATKEADTEEEDMNNNCSSWICQYCDRAFSESDRLLRHEMQHLIGQRV